MSSAIRRRSFSVSGTSPGDDALGEPFGDGGLADAGLTDEHRVVLASPGQHLNDTADLFVTSHDGIELARSRHVGQIAAVLLECLVLRLRIGVGDTCATAYGLERLQDFFAARTRVSQQLTGPVLGVGSDREEQMLGRDIFVLECVSLLERCLENPGSALAELNLAASAHAGERFECGRELLLQQIDRGAELLQHGDRCRRPVARAGRAAECSKRELGVADCCRGRLAWACALEMASWLLIVNLSNCMTPRLCTSRGHASGRPRFEPLRATRIPSCGAQPCATARYAPRGSAHALHRHVQRRVPATDQHEHAVVA